jgi:O-antigen/teichoic acid export membrane protein
MFANSIALILAKVTTMGLGFLSWLLAARLFEPAEVGLASGAVAAMMLCTQFALLGISSAVIFLYPQHKQKPERLLNTAFSMVGLGALVTALLFLALANIAFQELKVVASIPLFALLFVVMSVLGTAGILLDQVSTAIRRGDHMFVRDLAAGLVTLSVIAVLPMLAGATSALVIFSAWVAGGVTMFLLGSVQLWRSLSRYLYRPRFERPLARQLLGVGLPNYALTLTERAPALVMPIVVTELLSPEINAYWYTVWMMAWVVFIIPIQVGINLFAEASHRPEALGKVIRHGVWSSLGLGIVAAAGLALAAPIALSLLGERYADAGAMPLRILVVTVIPLTFIQAYFATCRARRKLREAVLTGIVSGLVAVTAAAAAGIEYGLTGMASAWLAAQLATGLWSLWRLWAISRSGLAGATVEQQQAVPPHAN